MKNPNGMSDEAVDAITDVLMYQAYQCAQHGVKTRQELAEVASEIYEEILRREKVCMVEYQLEGFPRILISDKVPKGELHVHDKNTGELKGIITGIREE